MLTSRLGDEFTIKCDIPKAIEERVIKYKVPGVDATLEELVPQCQGHEYLRQEGRAGPAVMEFYVDRFFESIGPYFDKVTCVDGDAPVLDGEYKFNWVDSGKNMTIVYDEGKGSRDIATISRVYEITRGTDSRAVICKPRVSDTRLGKYNRQIKLIRQMLGISLIGFLPVFPLDTLEKEFIRAQRAGVQSDLEAFVVSRAQYACLVLSATKDEIKKCATKLLEQS